MLENADFCRIHKNFMFRISELLDAKKVPDFDQKHVNQELFRGAAARIRTGDLILTKDALYRLSYSSVGDPERARTVDLKRDRLAF